MKVLQINTVYPVGSTGKIAKDIYDKCLQNDIFCKVAYRYKESNMLIDDTLNVSSWLDCHIHNRLASLTMLQGCFSHIRTLFFLRKVKKYNPDIIHLHNLHGGYINQPMLFKFIKKQKINIIWTLHDCWMMTGRCSYFDMVGCDKWKTQCYNCPQKGKAIFDNSGYMHRKKMKWFSGIENMNLIANSRWTASIAKASFLSQYSINVIYNGIDLTVFKPSEGKFKEKNNFIDSYMILGVAFGWNERKGIDVFVELAKRLPANYKIVLVGTDDNTDSILPDNIISIHRTHDQSELAEIYSAADLLVNPTREEAFGLVNIEALACGTPVLTFDTGGCCEGIDETCGAFVEKNDIDSMQREIIRICTEKPFSADNCVKRASLFNKNDKIDEYISLYKNICNNNADNNAALEAEILHNRGE